MTNFMAMMNGKSFFLVSSKIMCNTKFKIKTMLLDKIHLLAFFTAFAIGILLCYITKPKPTIIVKFPNPWNVDQTVYKDKVNSQCYKFKADKVSCPSDGLLIKPQPLHEDFSSRKNNTITK